MENVRDKKRLFHTDSIERPTVKIHSSMEHRKIKNMKTRKTTSPSELAAESLRRYCEIVYMVTT